MKALYYRVDTVVTIVPTGGWGMTGCDTWDAGVCTVTMTATRSVLTTAPTP